MPSTVVERRWDEPITFHAFFKRDPCDEEKQLAYTPFIKLIFLWIWYWIRKQLVLRDAVVMQRVTGRKGKTEISYVEVQNVHEFKVESLRLSSLSGGGDWAYA